ncbi:MAG TPA: hypothetical protein PK867_30475, partial [Pirellulales bacterium]|nr:hypothetical protein [Pirellulales bacterium]
MPSALFEPLTLGVKSFPRPGRDALQYDRQDTTRVPVGRLLERHGTAVEGDHAASSGEPHFTVGKTASVEYQGLFTFAQQRFDLFRRQLADFGHELAFSGQHVAQGLGLHPLAGRQVGNQAYIDLAEIVVVDDAGIALRRATGRLRFDAACGRQEGQKHSQARRVSADHVT